MHLKDELGLNGILTCESLKKKVESVGKKGQPFKYANNLRILKTPVLASLSNRDTQME